MSNDPTPPNGARPPDEYLEFQCPICAQNGLTYTIRRLAPRPSLMNDLAVSLVVYTHEQGFSCSRCNTYYQLGILGVQAAINWAIQPVERPSGIVAPPPGVRLT